VKRSAVVRCSARVNRRYYAETRCSREVKRSGATRHSARSNCRCAAVLSRRCSWLLRQGGRLQEACFDSCLVIGMQSKNKTWNMRELFARRSMARERARKRLGEISTIGRQTRSPDPLNASPSLQDKHYHTQLPPTLPWLADPAPSKHKSRTTAATVERRKIDKSPPSGPDGPSAHQRLPTLAAEAPHYTRPQRLRRLLLHSKDLCSRARIYATELRGR
jgi:hypothetical protein